MVREGGDGGDDARSIDPPTALGNFEPERHGRSSPAYSSLRAVGARVRRRMGAEPVHGPRDTPRCDQPLRSGDQVFVATPAFHPFAKDRRRASGDATCPRRELDRAQLTLGLNFGQVLVRRFGAEDDRPRRGRRVPASSERHGRHQSREPQSHAARNTADRRKTRNSSPARGKKEPPTASSRQRPEAAWASLARTQGSEPRGAHSSA